jgi:hypothetical protein
MESLGPPLEALAARLDALAIRAAAVDARLDAISATPEDAPIDRLDAINASLIATDRAWWDERGLFDRPWYRNLSIATDRFTGYGSTAMPIVAEPITDGDAEQAAEGVTRLASAIDRYEAALDSLDGTLNAASMR